MTARTGMATLISTVRGMSDAGTADWTKGAVTYWDDDEVQRVLDRHRMDVFRAEMDAILSHTSGGTVTYLQYHSGYGDIESGTAVFKLESAAGVEIGTATYTFDYARGVATFAADQAGSARFWSGHMYDTNAAAADMWRIKAANVAKLFNFSTDNHKIDRGELRKSYLDMADYYASQSEPMTVSIARNDIT